MGVRPDGGRASSPSATRVARDAVDPTARTGRRTRSDWIGLRMPSETSATITGVTAEAMIVPCPHSRDTTIAAMPDAIAAMIRVWGERPSDLCADWVGGSAVVRGAATPHDTNGRVESAR